MNNPAGVPSNSSLRGVALAYRMLVIGVLVGIAVNIAARNATGGALFPIALLALGILAWNIVWTVRLCKGLDRSPWLYAIGVCIPVIGLLALVVLSHAATKYLKSHGVEVGFFGAKL